MSKVGRVVFVRYDELNRFAQICSLLGYFCVEGMVSQYGISLINRED